MCRWVKKQGVSRAVLLYAGSREQSIVLPFPAAMTHLHSVACKAAVHHQVFLTMPSLVLTLLPPSTFQGPL